MSPMMRRTLGSVSGTANDVPPLPIANRLHSLELVLPDSQPLYFTPYAARISKLTKAQRDRLAYANNPLRILAGPSYLSDSDVDEDEPMEVNAAASHTNGKGKEREVISVGSSSGAFFSCSLKVHVFGTDC